jgi:hypothetical protein
MGCLIEFYESLTPFYTKMSFQNPQVFHQHVRFSPERSTLDGVPHGILGVFNTILYENEF